MKSVIACAVDSDLKIEIEAYSRAKGFGRSANLARVAIVQFMARNRLTSTQKDRCDKYHAELMRGPYAVLRTASGAK